MRHQTCHYSAEQLLAYLEETLPEKQNSKIEAHLIACSTCLALARRVTEFHDTVELLKVRPKVRRAEVRSK